MLISLGILNLTGMTRKAIEGSTSPRVKTRGQSGGKRNSGPWQQCLGTTTQSAEFLWVGISIRTTDARRTLRLNDEAAESRWHRPAGSARPKLRRHATTSPAHDSRSTGQPLSQSFKTEVFARRTIESGKMIPKYAEPTGSHVESITDPSESTFHAWRTGCLLPTAAYPST